jgi:hypothetical protein
MAEMGLNELQVEVLTLFFALPESQGFVLAGGAGLVAAGLSARPTEDVDLFSATASIQRAGEALEEAVEGRGWSIERIEASETFRRALLTTEHGDQLLIDIARDAAPLGIAVNTDVGPTYPPAELAARKVLALFDRAALRDFVDVANVSTQLDREDLLRLATEIDEGFDRVIFSEMLEALDRFTDDEIRQWTDPGPVRAFFRDWAQELRRGARGST